MPLDLQSMQNGRRQFAQIGNACLVRKTFLLATMALACRPYLPPQPRGTEAILRSEKGLDLPLLQKCF